jgi:hypothetical protein
MNEVYGIDPNIKFEVKDLHLLLKTFGFNHGRFIGQFPENQWIEIIKDNLNLTGYDASRLLRILQINNDGFIPIKCKYKIHANYPMDWLKNASDINSREKIFTEIFSNKTPFFNGPTVEDLLLSDDYDPSLSRGDHIPSNIEAYLQALNPLLIKSSEIHFLDRFFFSVIDSPKKNKLLKNLFIAAKKSNRCECIYFHLSLSKNRNVELPSENVLINRIRSIREDSGFYKLGIRLTFHENINHGRYFFSLKGGLQFDNGFELNSTNHNHVHWLSKNELDPLLDKYTENIIFKSI